MSGTISLSLSQQFDSLGRPLNGGKLYFYQAGTVATPQNAYQDSALTIPHSNPITLDSAGRVPQFFLADGSIKIVLTDANLITQISADNVLVVGPSSGGGGGGTVDPTTVLTTGDMKLVYNTGVLSGFVRVNGRTIGSATSGATERANSDCQSLFIFLWGADPNLSVSGSRGASAAADWAANKTITLPDFRGRAVAALDDMGNSPSGRLSGTYFGATTTLGIAAGVDHAALITDNLPPYTPAGTISNGAITINGTAMNIAGLNNNAGGGGGAFAAGSAAAVLTASQGTSTFTGTAQGGTSAGFSLIQPTMLITIYMKL